MDAGNENQHQQLFATKVIVLDTEASPDRDFLSKIAWIIYSGAGVPEDAYRATLVAQGYHEFDRLEALTLGSSASVLLRTKQSTLTSILEDLAESVKSCSPVTLAAHNVEWDASVIAEAEQQTGVTTGVASLPRLCTMLATARNYGRGEYLSLGKLHELLFGAVHRNAHDPLADAAACGACLGLLASRGVFRGYIHKSTAAKQTSRPNPSGLTWVSSRIISKAIRSASAEAGLRERASRASLDIGGIDQAVLDRIRRMPPERYQLFLRAYAATHSANAATYINRVLAASDRKSALKPETSWRCLAAYCGIADMGERRELANLYLTKRPKFCRRIEIQLGQADGPCRNEIGKLIEMPDFVRKELLTICGGSLDLAVKAEAEYKALGKWDDPFPLLTRYARGDKAVCGTHEFNLPYAVLAISIEPPSIAKRLLEFLWGR